MASSTGVFMLSVVLGDSRGALLARPCLQGSRLQRALQALISSSQHSCEVASHYFHSTDDKAEASKGVVTSISHTYKAEHRLADVGLYPQHPLLPGLDSRGDPRAPVARARHQKRQLRNPGACEPGKFQGRPQPQPKPGALRRMTRCRQPGPSDQFIPLKIFVKHLHLARHCFSHWRLISEQNRQSPGLHGAYSLVKAAE